MAEPAEHQIRHLHPVPEIEAEASPGSSPRPVRPVATGATSEWFRREMELFRSVRSAAPVPPASAVVQSPPARPVDGPVSQAAALASDATSVGTSTGELGERFQALSAGLPGGESQHGEAAERIDAALNRLRVPTSPGRRSSVLPSNALRQLAISGSPVAGEWLLALLAGTHRIAPGMRADVIPGGDVFAVTATADATVVDRPKRRRSRRDRDCVAIGDPVRLARAAAGTGARRVRGTRGVALLSALLATPHLTVDLIEDGIAVSPFALWTLIAASLPAAPGGCGGSFVHSVEGVGDATVQVSGGRPVKVHSGRSSGADGIVATSFEGSLRWVLGGADPISVGGDPSLEVVARTIAAAAFSPIRHRS